jgi:hypothetical protein
MPPAILTTFQHTKGWYWKRDSFGRITAQSSIGVVVVEEFLALSIEGLWWELSKYLVSLLFIICINRHIILWLRQCDACVHITQGMYGLAHQKENKETTKCLTRRVTVCI